MIDDREESIWPQEPFVQIENYNDTGTPGDILTKNGWVGPSGMVYESPSPYDPFYLQHMQEERHEAAATPQCEHEPIDVGFSKIKMVCKKCDKDLPQYE